MKRIHVFLPEPLLKQLKAEAKLRGLPLAHIIREWLDETARIRYG